MDTNTIALLQLLAGSKASGADESVLGKLLVAVIIALPAVLAYFKSREAVKNVKEVKLSINSRLDNWLAVERDQGVSDGRNQAHAEAGHQAATLALSTQEATTRAAAGRMTEDQLRDIVLDLRRQLEIKNNVANVAGARSDPPSQ